MRKELLLNLQRKADEVAKLFSRKDRAKNYNKETFSVCEVVILSESRAAVVYEKDGGTRSVADFLWIASGGSGRWLYYFPTDSHLLGQSRLSDIKFGLEQHNFVVRKSSLGVGLESLSGFVEVEK